MNGRKRDRGGDGCDWYFGHEDECGAYDSIDFQANQMCCACTDGKPALFIDLVKKDLFGEATVTAEYAAYINGHSPAHLLEDST